MMIIRIFIFFVILHILCSETYAQYQIKLTPSVGRAVFSELYVQDNFGGGAFFSIRYFVQPKWGLGFSSGFLTIPHENNGGSMSVVPFMASVEYTLFDKNVSPYFGLDAGLMRLNTIYRYHSFQNPNENPISASFSDLLPLSAFNTGLKLKLNEDWGLSFDVRLLTTFRAHTFLSAGVGVTFNLNDETDKKTKEKSPVKSDKKFDPKARPKPDKR